MAGTQWDNMASTSCHCISAYGFIVISMGMGGRFGPSWWWWQPLLLPSAVPHLTLTLSASGSVVHLLMGPSSLTVNHLDIRQRQGLGPLEVHKKLVPRGGGVWFRMWLGTLSSSPSRPPPDLSLVTRFPSTTLSFIVMVMMTGGCRHRQTGKAQVTENVWQTACFYTACISERLQLTGIGCGMCGYKRTTPPCVTELSTSRPYQLDLLEDQLKYMCHHTRVKHV